MPKIEIQCKENIFTCIFRKKRNEKEAKLYLKKIIVKQLRKSRNCMKIFGEPEKLIEINETKIKQIYLIETKNYREKEKKTTKPINACKKGRHNFY